MNETPHLRWAQGGAEGGSGGKKNPQYSRPRPARSSPHLETGLRWLEFQQAALAHHLHSDDLTKRRAYRAAERHQHSSAAMLAAEARR